MLEEGPQMVTLATHLGRLRPTSLEKRGTASGTMVLETGKNLFVQIHEGFHIVLKSHLQNLTPTLGNPSKIENYYR